MAAFGWKLDADDRARLIARVAPAYADVGADHVTLGLGNAPLPPAKAGEVVGLSDDGAGVQALVVRIDGDTARPDGSTFHITWSIDRARGRRPVDSNDVIARFGWALLDPPESIQLRPARF